MEEGKIYRATTFVVLGVLVCCLAWLEACGGYVAGRGSSSSSITGTIVDASTSAKTPIAGALVVLEQPDGTGIDRVIASTTSTSNGYFSLNSPSTGVFDVVADATSTPASGPTVTYAATVTFGVPVGANLNQIPLVPEFGSATTGIPATIKANVTAKGNSFTFLNQVDVQISALQAVSPAVGSVLQVTIPVFAGSTPSVTTANLSCVIGATCVPYTLVISQGDFSFGQFSASGTQYTLSPQTQATVNYTVEGRAFVHLAALSQDCAPSSSTLVISVGGGTAIPTPDLNFTGCS